MCIIIDIMSTFIDQDDLNVFINRVKQKKNTTGIIYFNIKYSEKIYNVITSVVTVDSLASIIKDYIDEHIFVCYKCVYRKWNSLLFCAFTFCTTPYQIKNCSTDAVFNYQPIYFNFTLKIVYNQKKNIKRFIMLATDDSFSFIKSKRESKMTYDYIYFLNVMIESICGDKNYIEQSESDEIINDHVFDKIIHNPKNNTYVCKKNKKKVIYTQIQDDYIVLNVCDIIMNLVHYSIDSI